MEYRIYTDGAYSLWHDKGSFAFIILNTDDKEIDKGAYTIEKESNNRAELKAIICGLHRLPSNASKVTIYSDSQYSIYTLSGKWQRKKNQDLFEVWDRVRKEHSSVQVTLEWVKGHNGDKYNEMCDQMCNDILGYDCNEEVEKIKEYKQKQSQQSISITLT